jgi:hypothetical protein
VQGWLFLLNLFSTLYMVGVIVTVQLVHYPLMDRVEPTKFRAFHAAHSRLMTWVVLLPMVVELATSEWLALQPLPGIPRWLLWLGLALAALTWAATFFVSVPLHGKLSDGFDSDTHRALVRTNWLRTVFWLLHGIVVLDILRRLLLRVCENTS